MNYLARVNKLQKNITEKNCDAFLITNVKDIIYFTGISLSAGRVLITKTTATLIVDGRYYESCKVKSSIPTMLAEKDTLWNLLKNAKTLAIDSEATSYQAFVDLQEQCNERAIDLLPLRGLVQQLRSRKDEDEILLLRKAGELGSKGFDFALSQLKEGISEEDLAYSLEQFWRKHGASGFSFPPIIAFGPPSSMPHYRASKGILKKGDIVLLDIGVELDHYNSDMTRVVFFGEANPELIKIHAIVREAMQAAFALCKPGTLTKELDEAARSVISAAGYGPNFTHSLGHGVGLDIHELPSIRQDPAYGETSLKEGMVITIEPGIYVPGVGGIRLEDMIAITKEGYENLTNRNYRFHV